MSKQPLLAVLATILFATSALAQGFGDPSGVGFPSKNTGGGGGLTSPVGISDGGTGQTTKAPAFNALSPLTTQGDILYGGASGAGTRLAKGTALQILRMNSGATAPEWATPAWATGDGGTGLSSFTGGDTVYYASGTALSKLAKGTALQYYRMNAGATAPEWATPELDVFPLQNSLHGRSVGWVVPQAYNPTTLSQVGFGGTAVSTGTLSNGSDADSCFVNLATSTTTGNAASGTFADYNTEVRWSPRFTGYIKTGTLSTDVQNCRIGVGLFNNTADAASLAVPTYGSALFRYDTSVDGTAFWRCVTATNTTNSTVTTTSVGVASNTPYQLRIECTPTAVTYYIAGSQVAQHTTNLPTSTTGLKGGMFITNLASTAVNIKLGKLWEDSY